MADSLERVERQVRVLIGMMGVAIGLTLALLALTITIWCRLPQYGWM